MATDAGAHRAAGAAAPPDADGARPSRSRWSTRSTPPQRPRYVYLVPQGRAARRFAGTNGYVDYAARRQRRPVDRPRLLRRRRPGEARHQQHRLRAEPARARSATRTAPPRARRPTASRATASPSPPTPTAGARPAAGWCASLQVAKPGAAAASTAPTSSIAGRAARSSSARTRRSRSSASRTSRSTGRPTRRCSASAPARCARIREVWGADSGTNVTKTETFYRDAVTYRYRVRVHPIPPDGLYTSWDYNRGDGAGAARRAGRRYYTALRPQGVPIDGINDDVGNVDELPDGVPAFFDVADPTFNLPLAFDNWEQVVGQGRRRLAGLHLRDEGRDHAGQPAVVPYYRDDACLDDGTGDDPVPRPWPGEAHRPTRASRPATQQPAGRPYDRSSRATTSRAPRAARHPLLRHRTTRDNVFLAAPVPLTEIDGQQWQFMVPSSAPAQRRRIPTPTSCARR